MRMRLSWALSLVVAVTLAGCAGTFGAVSPQGLAERPSETPKVLVLQDIHVADTTWETYKPQFAKGLSEWIEKNGAIVQVITDSATTPPTDSIVLTGTLTELDKGSAAMRFWVGMGAGQSKAKGDFVLR